jgi:hypothetical protein
VFQADQLQQSIVFFKTGEEVVLVRGGGTSSGIEP